MAKHDHAYLAYIWEFLRTRRNRRGTTRYNVNPEHEACLAWPKDDGHAFAEAKIQDLSQSGARVVVDVVAPQSGHVWLRLSAPESTDWVEATIVRIKIDRWHCRSELRIRFDTPCPYDFFKAAINGFSAKAGYMTIGS